jgi:hypothetical protein
MAWVLDDGRAKGRNEGKYGEKERRKQAREKALADLTDAEKNAIYSINGDIIELQGDLLDKLC